MPPPHPTSPARTLFARLPAGVPFLLVFTTLLVLSVTVLSLWQEYDYPRHPHPHRLAISPRPVAQGGELTIRGEAWGDVLDDGTGPHVDIYVLDNRCTSPSRSSGARCVPLQKARARLADDGTFATTITLQKNLSGSHDIYVVGPDPHGAKGYSSIHVEYHRPTVVGQGTTKGGHIIGILAWLILGLIAGFIASKIMGAGGYGLVGDIIVGIIGAVLGGFLFGLITGRDAMGLENRLAPRGDRRGLPPDRHPARRLPEPRPGLNRSADENYMVSSAGYVGFTWVSV